MCYNDYIERGHNMKMICVDNQFDKKTKRGLLSLTVGKEYEVEELNVPNAYEEIISGQPKVGGYVTVTNDKGVTQTYNKGRFRMI